MKLLPFFLHFSLSVAYLLCSFIWLKIFFLVLLTCITVFDSFAAFALLSPSRVYCHVCSSFFVRPFFDISLTSLARKTISYDGYYLLLWVLSFLFHTSWNNYSFWLLFPINVILNISKLVSSSFVNTPGPYGTSSWWKISNYLCPSLPSRQFPAASHIAEAQSLGTHTRAGAAGLRVWVLKTRLSSLLLTLMPVVWSFSRLAHSPSSANQRCARDVLSFIPATLSP